jgi:hypothetical protein
MTSHPNPAFNILGYLQRPNGLFEWLHRLDERDNTALAEMHQLVTDMLQTDIFYNFSTEWGHRQRAMGNPCSDCHHDITKHPVMASAGIQRVLMYPSPLDYTMTEGVKNAAFQMEQAVQAIAALQTDQDYLLIYAAQRVKLIRELQMHYARVRKVGKLLLDSGHLAFRALVNFVYKHAGDCGSEAVNDQIRETVFKIQSACFKINTPETCLNVMRKPVQ